MLDNFMKKMAEASSDKMGRRSFLKKVGKVAFAITGVTILQNLPHFNPKIAEAGYVNCNAWYLCGIVGYSCESCDNIASNSCPYTLQNSWTICCDDGWELYKMNYRDCCTSNTSVSCTNGTWCNNSAQPNWCYSGYKYICGVFKNLGLC